MIWMTSDFSSEIKELKAPEQHFFKVWKEKTRFQHQAKISPRNKGIFRWRKTKIIYHKQTSSKINAKVLQYKENDIRKKCEIIRVKEEQEIWQISISILDYSFTFFKIEWLLKASILMFWGVIHIWIYRYI